MVRNSRKAGDTVSVLGDLNTDPNSRTGQILRSGGLRFVDIEGSTFHFNIGLNATGPVDHILYSENADAVGPATVIRKRPGRIWPSDHYPVIADVIIH